MLSPSFESSTLFRAASQYWNDLVRFASNLSLSVSGAGRNGGVGILAALLHSSMFDMVICNTRWPNVICAGVGLQPNLSAGISATSAIRFFCWRDEISLTVSVTGFLGEAVFVCAFV